LGILQQVDTPQSLYDSPDNMFVAGFIGSPAMNFFEMQISGTAQEMYAEGPGFKLRLPTDKGQALDGYLGKQVVFGIRPEDIHDREYAPPGIIAEAVTAAVDVTELMGSEVYVYLITDSKTYIGRFDPRTSARVGKEIDAVFDMANVQFFDPDTELAIR
jgi:multiple sugar transport system ATP-binding protein